VASKKKADNSRVIEAAESFGKAMYEEKINQMEQHVREYIDTVKALVGAYERIWATHRLYVRLLTHYADTLNFGIPEIVEDPARLRASVRAAIDADVFGMYDARKKCLAARKAIFPEGKE
jgi:hypothetical protein